MTIEEFMKSWNLMTRHRQAVEAMLQPALEGIKEYYFPRSSQSVLLDDLELCDTHNIKSVIFQLSYFSGNEHKVGSFTIPLDVCLAGRGHVLCFFRDEKLKQEEQAREMGRKREAKDREDRRRQFLELKLEFEPKEDALVKLQDV